MDQKEIYILQSKIYYDELNGEYLIPKGLDNYIKSINKKNIVTKYKYINLEQLWNSIYFLIFTFNMTIFTLELENKTTIKFTVF